MLKKAQKGKKDKYDVIIVGAGPAGIFSCFELIKKNPKIKIALIEMGNPSHKRKKNEVMSGFGGAGTYSDGKLQFTPKISHERVLDIITTEEYQKILDDVDKIFMNFGMDAIEYPKNPDEAEMLIEEARKYDLELIVRRAKHMGTDNLKKIINKFQNFLLSNGVDILFNTEVTDLICKNKTVVGVKTPNKNLYSKCVLMAPGRIKARWLQELGDKHGIEYKYDMVEVGVRVEFNHEIMRKYAEALYEIVFKIRTDTFDNIIRTFCTCPNGMVAREDYQGFVCVNGHSNSDHASENSNFAFVVEVNLTEPVENSLQYAQSIAELATTIGGGNPILQRLADLRKGRRSTWGRINKSMVKPTLTDVTPGDISMALPYRIVKNILEGLEKLDKVMPGINSGSTLLYAPEVKFRSSKVKTTKGMETSIKNLHVAGDASGLSGTITGAAATGIMAARGMLKSINSK